MQQKILARGDVSVEDEIADSVFVQVTSLVISTSFYSYYP